MRKQDPSVVLRKILGGISPAEEEDYQLELTYIPDARDRLPLPYMVLLTVILGTDCKFTPRPMEKTAWVIGLRFTGVPFRLEHGKFGMRIATARPPDDPLVDDLVQVLNRAFPVADRVLQPHVDAQVRAGNVTLPNLYYLFRNRYEFFRHKAELAFEKPRPRLGGLLSSTKEKPRTLDPFKHERQGFYLGGAAIDAYFSWLEHILILLLPFAGYDPASDNLVEFIGKPWKAKLKRIWDLSADRVAKELYDSLHDIKERFRNAMAHGGLEKDGSSLAVHVAHVGAIPARLSRFTESIHHGLFPLKDASFAEACDLFDRVDAYLTQGHTAYGMMFAGSGLDVSFDAEMRKDYEAAMTSHEDFCDWLEGLGRHIDDLVNMDW